MSLWCEIVSETVWIYVIDLVSHPIFCWDAFYISLICASSCGWQLSAFLSPVPSVWRLHLALVFSLSRLISQVLLNFLVALLWGNKRYIIIDNLMLYYYKFPSSYQAFLNVYFCFNITTSHANLMYSCESLKAHQFDLVILHSYP